MADVQAQDLPPNTAPTTPQSTIRLRSPIKYNLNEAFQTPPLEWLVGTWSVTHSTLPMWRKAKNVLINYTLIPPSPSSPNGPTLLDDTVSSIPIAKTWLPQPKSIHGIDTPDGDGAWNWRGKGWLRIASSHWEVLGWGERGGERWVVTWFAPSMFTPAGLDIYCNRREGMSEGLYGELMAELGMLKAADLSALVKSDMLPVKIEY